MLDWIWIGKESKALKIILKHTGMATLSWFEMSFGFKTFWKTFCNNFVIVVDLATHPHTCSMMINENCYLTILGL